MVRGIEGSRIFRDEQDREEFVSRIGRQVEKMGTRVVAWALMDTHIHLLSISGYGNIEIHAVPADRLCGCL